MLLTDQPTPIYDLIHKNKIIARIYKTNDRYSWHPNLRIFSEIAQIENYRSSYISATSCQMAILEWLKTTPLKIERQDLKVEMADASSKDFVSALNPSMHRRTRPRPDPVLLTNELIRRGKYVPN